MRNILRLLIVCAICAGCKKNRTAIVKGRVINPITQSGHENYEVRILKATSGSIGTMGGYDEVAETFTDANGNFEIQYTGSGSLLLSCNLPVENYPIGWYQNGQKVSTSTTRMNIQKGEETYAEYHSVPYKDVYISLKSINCEGSSDVNYVASKQLVVPNDEFNGPSLGFMGCTDEINYENLVAGFHIYRFISERPSGTYTVYDTIFVDPNGINDTVYLEY